MVMYGGAARTRVREDSVTTVLDDPGPWCGRRWKRVVENRRRRFNDLGTSGEMDRLLAYHSGCLRDPIRRVNGCQAPRVPRPRSMESPRSRARQGMA